MQDGAGESEEQPQLSLYPADTVIVGLAVGGEV